MSGPPTCEPFTFSESGGHAVNEDAFAVQSHPGAADCWLCVLADGQGGQPGGGRAAQLACDTAMTVATRLPPHTVGSAAAWMTILRAADEAVRTDPKAGYTTLIGLCLAGGQVCDASSGDSAALLVHGDVRQTQALTADQIKNPPVGSGAAPFIPFEAALAPPWTVLVMSDGVWKYVGWERLAVAAKGNRGRELIAALEQQARLPGSGRFQDDFTLVVLQDAGK